MSVLLIMMLAFRVDDPVEMLPGIWVSESVVEIDASVAMDCHHPETPDVYLEMMITGPDTREHESLLVSDVTPANLHAGLLAAGFVPGSPIRFDDQHRIPATGDRVLVETRLGDTDEWVELALWVVHVENGSAVTLDAGWGGLVFAGSTVNEAGVYAADREGALVSLTPWGFETVSPVWVVSPDASIDEPVWIANRELVPEKGEEVRVRFRRVEAEDDQEFANPVTQVE
ncbi:MAG: YdjY domain-containing protein [Phycisphaerales bacterium]